MTDFCRKRIRERSEPTPSLHVRERPAAAWEGMSKAAFVLSWTRSLRTRTEPRAPCKHRRTWAGQVRVVAGKARPKTRGTPLNVESAGRRHHRSPHRRIARGTDPHCTPADDILSSTAGSRASTGRMIRATYTTGPAAGRIGRVTDEIDFDAGRVACATARSFAPPAGSSAPRTSSSAPPGRSSGGRAARWHSRRLRNRRGRVRADHRRDDGARGAGPQCHRRSES
jgi:hypothetical protein